MNKTIILNKEECGYSYFVTIGKTIIACGLGGTRKLDIIRAVVVADNSVKNPSFLSRQLICKPHILYDVDVDLFLADGTLIKIHSTEKKFLRMIIPYVWELRRNDPRVNFYGEDTIDTTEDDIENLREELSILEHQIGAEKKISQDLQNRLDSLLVYKHPEDIKVVKVQRQFLASRKKLIGYKNRMNKLNIKLIDLEGRMNNGN